MVIIFLLYTLLAKATVRDLSKGEEDALYAVWGIRSIQAFIELEKNPQDFWEKRSDEIFSGPKRAITHLDFCLRYIADAKAHIARKLQKIDSPPPWFQTENAIEDVLKGYIEQDDPQFFYALATIYAAACDYTQTLHCGASLPAKILRQDKERIQALASQKALRAKIANSAQRHFTDLIPISHKHIRWKILPGGLFPIIDGLIAQSQGIFLCSVDESCEGRDAFSVHGGQLQQWSGAHTHDAFVHSSNEEAISILLKRFGLSSQTAFDICCNPNTLATGDLMTMTEQVLTWFHHFHEIPAEPYSFDHADRRNTFSFIFPRTTTLLDEEDEGLRALIPYFAQRPPGFNWRTTPLQKKPMSYGVIRDVLCCWRFQYCFQGVFLLNAEGMSAYINSLSDHLSSTMLFHPKSASDFVQNILEHLYTLEKSEAMTPLFCGVQGFKEQVSLTAQNTVCSLTRIAPHSTGRHITVRLPLSALFFTLTVHAKELKDLTQDFGLSFFWWAKKSRFGLLDINGQYLATIEIAS